VLENTLLSITNIPQQQLEMAQQLAWSRSMINPLHLALNIEAAGYLELAFELICKLGYSVEDAMAQGTETLQRYYGFLMRSALSRGDERSALRHAEDVLHYVAISSEAAAAGRVLKNNSADDEVERRYIGNLVNLLAANGSIWSSSSAVLPINSSDKENPYS
jgi:hypothetical protein